MRPVTVFRFRNLWILVALITALPVAGIKPSSATAGVWGSKPVLAHFVLDQEQAHRLQEDLNLTQAQSKSISQIAKHEADRVEGIEAESMAVVGDPNLSRLQKAQWVAQSAHNRRLLAVVGQSQEALRESLGDETYRRLVDWIETQWEDEVQGYLPQTGIQKVLGEIVGPLRKTYPRSFEVYATRYDAGERKIVALPDKCLKFANGGALRCDGYDFGQDYSVAISYGGNMVVALVAESGPWNIDDNYWSKASDPQPRRKFADLPLGLPEAQAAYFNGYNGGLDQFGRLVTSPVAIDISKALAADLGLPPGNNKVTVSFLWTEGWDSSQPQQGAGTASPGQVSPPAGNAVIAWQTSTPNPDGSIVHVVQSGQTLVGIATIYQVPLDDLLGMNGLTMQSVIQPGESILVKRADPTPTVTVSSTPTASATATSSPSPVASPTRMPTQTFQPTATETVSAQYSSKGMDFLLIAILVVILAGLSLLAWGWLIHHKKPG